MGFNSAFKGLKSGSYDVVWKFLLNFWECITSVEALDTRNDVDYSETENMAYLWNF